MATIKTFGQISQSMIDNISLRQPALDTKPSTVARDIFIDNVADQLAIIYRNYNLIQKTQSILSSTGQILDQFGSNYGIIRDPGKRAGGNAVLTFNNLLNNINIASGTTVTAKTGVVFQITANIIISAATKGVYSSYANSIKTQLSIAGISDQYAVQIPIEALNVGSNGNIPIYSLIKTSIPGISNVTNISATSGGTSPQGDSLYRNQILAGLTGSAAGTARGYQNALLAVSGIQSVYVASPGNPILTRDGTITQRNTDGTISILSPGTGGKVDIWLQGTDFINIIETYTFHDASGTGNITSPLDDHVFGQTTATINLTPIERRQLFVQTGQLPLQPVDSIISLTGSISGSNFIQDVNFSLTKDTNPETANTAFALDRLVFLQNFVSINSENTIKGNLNNTDTLVFQGIKAIDIIHQSIIVTNDLAILDLTDHTQINISHIPLDTVLRATNLTTGERYIIVNQNLNTDSSLNTSGAIYIDGSILPSPQDLIQVDYTWHFIYDPTTDYFSPNSNDLLSNGVDWGKSNYIKFENGLLIRNGNRYNISISRSIDRIYNIYYCDTQITSIQSANHIDQTGVIKALTQVTISIGLEPVVYFKIPGINLISSNISIGSIVYISFDTASTPRNGSYTINGIIDQVIFQVQPPFPALIVETGDAIVEIRAADNTTILLPSTTIFGLSTVAEEVDNIINVVSVISQTTGLELYSTKNGGTFSGNIIYLATDVVQPQIGEQVIVYFNSHELYNIAKNNGGTNNNIAILSTDDVLDFNSVLQPLNDIFNGISVKPIFINYITADIDVVARTPISSMPFVGSTTTSNIVDKNNNLLVSRQPIEFNGNGNIIRTGPAYLVFTVDGGFSSGGSFAIRGTGWVKFETTITITQNNTNGNFDLLNNITSQIGNLSSNYIVAKLISATLNNGIDVIPLSISGYVLSNNIYDYGVAVQSSSVLPTSIDIGPVFSQNNIAILTIGSTIDIVFYVLATNIAETIQFTSGRGVLYSDFKYTRIDRIDLISGFVNPTNLIITGNLRVGRLSQPNSSSTYMVDYSYYAPVENELISIQYRYNNIIADATNAIEGARTLTADVLARLAIKILVNVSMTIILTNQAINQSGQIINQAISAVSNLITGTSNGAELDYSSFLRVVTAISGVQGADVIVFDYVSSDFNGMANRKSLQADANQYFFPATINIVTGSR